MATVAVKIPYPVPPEPRPRPKQKPDRAAMPGSFQEALKLGWTVVKEETTITINNRKRNAVVFLPRCRKPQP